MNIEDYKKALKSHDWFYSFSDDGRVFRNGESENSRLLGIAKANGAAFQREFNLEYAKYFHGKSFGPGPHKFPFPEVDMLMDDPAF